MRFDGNPATVVFDSHRSVGVDGDLDFLGKPGHRLVDRVVDDFVHQMMQAARRNVTDVHRRPLADVIHIRQVLQVLRRVVTGGSCAVHLIGWCRRVSRCICGLILGTILVLRLVVQGLVTHRTVGYLPFSAAAIVRHSLPPDHLFCISQLYLTA